MLGVVRKPADPFSVDAKSPVHRRRPQPPVLEKCSFSSSGSLTGNSETAPLLISAPFLSAINQASAGSFPLRNSNPFSARRDDKAAPPHADEKTEGLGCRNARNFLKLRWTVILKALPSSSGAQRGLMEPGRGGDYGYLGLDLVGRPVPEPLKPLLQWCDEQREPEPDSYPQPERGCCCTSAINSAMKCLCLPERRCSVPNWVGASARRSSFIPLRAWTLCRTGKVAKAPAARPPADFEDRLTALFEDFAHGGLPFGVLWSPSIKPRIAQDSRRRRLRGDARKS